MNKVNLATEVKLDWLKRYMHLWIDQWPVNNLSFDEWLHRTFTNKGFLRGASVKTKRVKPKCFYCDTVFTKHNTKTIDHIIAKALGGNDKKGNYVNSCFQCNQLKADRNLTEFVITLDLLRKIDKSLLHPKYKSFSYDRLTIMIKNTLSLIDQVKDNLHLLTNKN